MTPLFYLGLSIALLAFPLGFACGFNSKNGEELKKFNDNQWVRLKGVVE